MSEYQYYEWQTMDRPLTDTVQVTMELPRAVLSALRKEPASFIADMRIAAAVKWYELEMVSQAKAAEIAGLSRAEAAWRARRGSGRFRGFRR